MSDSKNRGFCIAGLKYRLFMARSHFSVATAAIKALKYAISGSELSLMAELCLIIRGENSVETEGAKMSAAARRPRAAARSQNSTAQFPAAWGGSAAGLPERESAPGGVGNSWDWTPPRSQLAGPALLEAPSLVSVGTSDSLVAPWLSPTTPAVTSGSWLSLRVRGTLKSQVRGGSSEHCGVSYVGVWPGRWSLSGPEGGAATVCAEVVATGARGWRRRKGQRGTQPCHRLGTCPAQRCLGAGFGRRRACWGQGR